jgi:ABC-2 type transport system permease protein
MHAFLAVVGKELKSVLRERTIVIAILIQLFVASFSSALLLGMLSLYDSDTIVAVGGSHISVGLVSSSSAGTQTRVLSSLLSAQGTHVTLFNSFQSARTAFDAGKLDAILVVPVDQAVMTLKLYLPPQEAQSSFTRTMLQKPLEAYENDLRLRQGVDIHFTGLKGKPSTSFEFAYAVILPVLMFFPAFVAGGMVIDSLSEEVENNTLQTLLSAPISVLQLVLAKMSAALILAGLQCVAWLVMLSLNRIVIQNAAWVLALAVIVAAILSTLAGLVVVFLKDRERSQFVFSLLLLGAAGSSYFIDLSPLKTISRLAINDYYTSGWQVGLFALLLAGLMLLLVRFSRRLMG